MPKEHKIQNSYLHLHLNLINTETAPFPLSAKYALPAVPQYDTAACRFFSCRSAVLFPLISPNKNCAGFRQQNKTAVRKQLLFPLAAGTKGKCFFVYFFRLSARSSAIWVTRTLLPFLCRPPLICMVQPGQSVTMRSA